MHRWGFLGLGAHASRVMLPALREIDAAALVAVASKSGRNLAALARHFPEAVVYRDYEALLADDRIECVYIGLANDLHASLAIAALAAGKHVLCEKPLATSYAETRAVQASARSAGKLVAEGFMYRFHPQHRQVHQLLAGGTLGELELLEAHFHYTLADRSDIRFRRERGGGALLDAGCYLLDCSRWYFGALPQAASAVMRIDGEEGIDTLTNMQLQFASGRAAHLSCGITFGRQNDLVLHCTRGVVTLRSAFLIPRARQPLLSIKQQNEGEQVLRAEAANAYKLMLKAFAQSCSTGRLDPRFGDGVETGLLIELVSKAASSGSLIPLKLL